MKKLNFLHFGSFILFTMIYFTASIVLLGSQYRPLSIELIITRYALVLLGFIVLVFIYFFKNGLKVFRFPSFLSFYIFILWILFSLTVVISEVMHHSFPLQGFFFLLVVPFIYYTVMPYMTKLGGPVIHHSLFAANMIYVLISFFTRPVEMLPYSGIAANPNGLGQIGAITVITGIFILITLSNKRIFVKLLIIAVMLLSLVGVILSSSRTSFVIVGIITLMVAAHFTVARKNYKPFLVLLVVGFIAWFTPIRDMLLSGLIEKFSGLYHDGNLLNYRTIVWGGVFRELSLFGHGEDYFQHFVEGAHNSIIYILGVYGLIPAILLSTFLVLLILSAIKYTIHSKNQKLAIFPLTIIVTFILFSMTESMFGLVGNGITIAFYHAVGILLFREEMITGTDFNTPVKITNIKA